MTAKRVRAAWHAVLRFIGAGGRAFRNEASDLVVQSADGMREVRFDFKETFLHEYPHTHVIEYRRVKNKKIPDPNRRIWPSDLPQRWTAMNEKVDMLLECVDSFQSEERPDGGRDIHINVPRRFADLWLVKLSELRATMEEIHEYEPEDAKA